jgi:hypothetical protein
MMRRPPSRAVSYRARRRRCAQLASSSGRARARGASSCLGWRRSTKGEGRCACALPRCPCCCARSPWRGIGSRQSCPPLPGRGWGSRRRPGARPPRRAPGRVPVLGSRHSRRLTQALQAVDPGQLAGQLRRLEPGVADRLADLPQGDHCEHALPVGTRASLPAAGTEVRGFGEVRRHLLQDLVAIAE